MTRRARRPISQTPARSLVLPNFLWVLAVNGQLELVSDQLEHVKRTDPELAAAYRRQLDELAAKDDRAHRAQARELGYVLGDVAC